VLRIWIVGQTGYAAEHWAWLTQVQRAGGCRIVANAVVDAENHTARLGRLRRSGVRVFNSALEMYDGMCGRMDAVTIPTSIHTHSELMIAAVNRGYHVYLEKPPAATIQEVDSMIAALRQTGKVCAVGFQALWPSTSRSTCREAGNSNGPCRTARTSSRRRTSTSMSPTAAACAIVV
jgi:predicted dehydrogenase